MKRLNERLFNAVSVGSNQTSPILNCGDVYCISIVSTFAGGTPSGVLKFQGSNDMGDKEDGTGVVNWADIGTPRTLSAAGTFADNLDAIGYKFIRVVYTAGGTGTMTVWFNGKGA